MKTVKKLLAVLLSLAFVAALFAGCSSSNGEGGEAAAKVKAGFIYLHDENSTYDKNFITAAKAACEALGVEYVEKMNIDENSACYEAAVDLVEQGCSIIFADSFGHEDYMIEAAAEFPDVQFCHSTGTKSHTQGLSNYHNAFASIYQGRYLAGIAAGMKLNEMIEKGDITAEEAIMGYVGAYTYAEVLSGYTSFYLGAKSVCESVTMKVQFTGSWYDYDKEYEAAKVLIGDGCVLISQHADSLGAPTACQENNIPNVAYNGSTYDSGCEDTYIISSRINWQPYYEYALQCVIDGKAIDNDWTGDLTTDSVVLTDLNTQVAAEGTQEAIDTAMAALKDESLYVFDTSTFTVTKTDELNVNATIDESGRLTSYKADVDTDAAYEADTEAVSGGHFNESVYRSAPYFDVQIDGITMLNTAF